MRVLKILVGLIVLVVVAFVGGGLVLDDKAHAERQILLGGSPATVFTVLNGFRQFQKWSPWAELDPNAKIETSGPLMGVGAKQAWSSEDPNVGSGSQEIVESVPYERIKLKLVFSGFDSENWATYTLKQEGEGTKLTWSYDTDAGGNIIYRWFGLMLDRMLGPDYEKGLARLKTLVDGLPKDDFSDLQLEVVDVKSLPVAQMAGEAAAADAGPVLADRYGKIQAFMAANNLRMVDAPLAITTEFDEKTKHWKFVAAIPVDRGDVTTTPESEVLMGTTYAGLAIRAVHKGPYSALEPTYQKLLAFKAAAGLEDNGNSWESYVTDPTTTPEAELTTHVYWPVK